MGLKVGWRNRSAMRELANELERKKNLRKKEERREARERERKKIGNVFLTREEREV